MLIMTALKHWTEVLRCPNCGLAGIACLAQANGFEAAVVINDMPVGFRPVSSEYGDTYFCESCDRPAT
jgi:hypothetical protein